MAGDATSKPSFSPLRKWGIALNLAVRTAAVFALVVMINYLSGRYFSRFHLSSDTNLVLSPRTVSVLKSLTNDVNVILYYDRADAAFSTITALLNEYSTASPHFSVRVVDFNRDAAEAEKVKTDFRPWLGSDPRQNKDLVIFSCDRRVQILPGEALMKFKLEQTGRTTDGKIEFDRRPVAFNGEMAFTAMLLAVTSSKTNKACFLQHHDERQFDAQDEDGYLTFTSMLLLDNVRPEPLSLLGTNGVPADCDLLIIAGPVTPLTDGELEKIDQYLRQGGRLLALFDYRSRKRATGLEKLLADWGVEVSTDVVQDPDYSLSKTREATDVMVGAFSQQHPIVNPLLRSWLYLTLPRVVRRLDVNSRSADAPKVEEIMFSGPNAFVNGDPEQKARYPLAVAVEKGAVPGVVTERGTTRIVVVGDSVFLGNHQIESADNRYFAGLAANWLLDRPVLLQGLGPRPVTEYRLTMTRLQRRSVQWLLLAALPGAVLLLGGLVWLRRRK